MGLHPDVKRFLQSPFADPFSNIRQDYKEVRSQLNITTDTSYPSVCKVEDQQIQGKECSIPIRIYTPYGKGPFPIVIFFHGGGFVTGSIAGKDGMCRIIASNTSHKVISVGYRLAPENPFPAAPEDCYYATKWVSENASDLEADANNISVMGTSAGGNLATVVSIMSRDRGGPDISKQILIYPVTDYYQQGKKTPYRSFENNGEGYYLTKKSMDGFWSLYLSQTVDQYNPYACPIRAKNLSNLPPTLMITAEFDPVRDEGEEYARRLRAFHIPVKLIRYKGMIHGFLKFNTLGATKNVYDQIHQFLMKDIYSNITEFR